MDKNKLKFISSEKKKVYAELWRKNKVKPVAKADEKAGYPPNCNEGYVEKDGKCVPTSKKAKAYSSLSQEEAIDYSVRIVKALEFMRADHNKNNPQRKVTINQLKEVYYKNAGDCQSSKKAKQTCNQWALGCVNAYLRLRRNKKIKRISISSNLWTPSKEDFNKAEENIKQFKLNFDFGNIEDLYIQTQPLGDSSRPWM
jgi:hypothetical protein